MTTSNTSDKYRCIGKGHCGSVWALEDSFKDARIAVKREDCGPGRSVTNDYNMHRLVLEAASRLAIPPSNQIPLSIPGCHQLVQPADPWWQDQLPRFPPAPGAGNTYTACRALLSERIPKVPRVISDKLTEHGVAPRLFTLRNVPLHIDQMDDLGLDTKAYACTMADTLALMHWGAKIDAKDVEFVLAPPRPNGPCWESEYLGRHCMWILDFDCCRPMNMNEEGVRQACDAFYGNDPYFPRPGIGDARNEELWKVFKRRFTETSRGMMGADDEKNGRLPELLMEMIEERGREIQRKKAELASQRAVLENM